MEVNLALIGACTDYIGITSKQERLSELLPEFGQKNVLIADVSAAVGATTYLSGTGGGREYADAELLAASGIELRFDEFEPPEYPQLWGAFEPRLSILDALFNCGAAGCRELLGTPLAAHSRSASVSSGRSWRASRSRSTSRTRSVTGPRRATPPGGIRETDETLAAGSFEQLHERREALVTGPLLEPYLVHEFRLAPRCRNRIRHGATVAVQSSHVRDDFVPTLSRGRRGRRRYERGGGLRRHRLCGRRTVVVMT